MQLICEAVQLLNSRLTKGNYKFKSTKESFYSFGAFFILILKLYLILQPL